MDIGALHFELKNSDLNLLVTILVIISRAIINFETKYSDFLTNEEELEKIIQMKMLILVKKFLKKIK